jgi:hypothetical protein
MAKREKWDMNNPETKALRDQIIHGSFVKEGTMVAFPTCFPGGTVPIPPDESHITALGMGNDGIIYGGTSGRAVHLFVGIFHGITGIVFDRGQADGADSCVAVCWGKDGAVACVNGEAGGRLIGMESQPLPHDLIQEWGFTRTPLKELGTPVAGEKIVHAVMDAHANRLVGTTENHLFAYDPEKGSTEILAEVAGNGQLAAGSVGQVYGFDSGESLWRLDSGLSMERGFARLPKGSWASPRWTRDPRDGLLYTADASGRLYSFREGEGFSPELGRTSLTPVGPMAVTLDGRLFGTCGSGISRLFCFDPQSDSVSDLGVAASVLQRRRYGYEFGAAVVGRDGEIVFGEDDDRGHLWLYFPKIR